MPKQSPHDAVEIAPGTVVDGRYRVGRSIGQGGNGMVYEVEHVRTGRKLALKALLDETGFARLEQEARAASLMKNGHTARIVDMEAGGQSGAYMVMELLEGQSLRALLDDAGQLPFELTVNIAMQVCECLHEAHGLGIIHRDLKPENVFLCHSPWPGQYDVKVLDFGVMKIADGGGAIPKSSLTRTGSTVGTPYYMSLEQLRNSSAVDARADVYSLGVVLYECLSGRKPFQADTIGDLVYALCSGPPTHLARLRPDVQAEMVDLVMRTLSSNRDDRPASVLDLALALLPSANQAFSLWVRVDGKQPALAHGPSQPAVPRQALPTLTLEAGPVAAAAPGRAEPRPRDTPTEMYVKGEHGGVLAPEAEAGERRDRDTPTRAIPVDALMRRPHLATLKSPIALPEDDVPEVPTLDLRDGARLVPPAREAAARPLDPGAPTAKLTIPLGAFLQNAPPPPPAGPLAKVEPGRPAPSRSKPAWQAAIDRALIRAGHFAETEARRFRAAPQNTQIIVVIVVGTVTILALGFVLFLAMH